MKSLLVFVLAMVAADVSHACIFLKPNYSKVITGNLKIVRDGKVYESCQAKFGYYSLKDNSLFRTQALIIDCKDFVYTYNSLGMRLKNGTVNSELPGFNGSYNSNQIEMTYFYSDKHETFTDVSKYQWSADCKSLSLSVDQKIKGWRASEILFEGTLTVEQY